MEDNLNEKSSTENKVDEINSDTENKKSKDAVSDENKVEKAKESETTKEGENKENKPVVANRKILDYNSSWLTMIIYLGYLVVIFFVQRNAFEHSTVVKNQYAFYFLSLIIGTVVCFAFHNILKIIGALASGYKLLYINFFGLKLTVTDKKTSLKFKVTFDDLLSTSMRFVSKDEKVDRNPSLIFLLGYVGDLLFVGLGLILYFTSSAKSVVHLYSLYSMLYGLVLPIYELIPFRQDEANDMYNILRTFKKEDKIAYNSYYINIKREIEGVDPLVQKFDNYESFYKSQVLYFNYLDALYNNNMEEALNYIKDMNYVVGYIPDNDKYLATLEMIYLRFLVDDNDNADKLYLSLKGENKSACVRPSRLSGYRTALLIDAFVIKDKDRVKNVISGYKTTSKAVLERDTNRIKCENKYFLEAYNKVKTAHPEFNLDETINLD